MANNFFSVGNPWAPANFCRGPRQRRASVTSDDYNEEYFLPRDDPSYEYEEEPNFYDYYEIEEDNPRQSLLDRFEEQYAIDDENGSDGSTSLAENARWPSVEWGWGDWSNQMSLTLPSQGIFKPPRPNYKSSCAQKSDNASPASDYSPPTRPPSVIDRTILEPSGLEDTAWKTRYQLRPWQKAVSAGKRGLCLDRPLDCCQSRVDDLIREGETQLNMPL